MDWNIPRTSGKQPLQITLEAGDRLGDRLFMVGANGSGKSALLQNLASSQANRPHIRWITAHRQTWLESGNITLTLHNRREVDKHSKIYNGRPDTRWKDHNSGEMQAAVLFDLVADENERARSITRHFDNERARSITRHFDDWDFKDALRVSSESASPFAQINELLALGTLTVSLENSKGEEILAQHGNGGGKFSIEKMSDGERSAVIMAANVVTAKPATVFLIDEPERHLHRAIIVPFLSALFNQRKDCSFVVSTHEIALPVANPDARILKVRSCTWNGDIAKAWDVEVLEPNTELPEELKLAILGARERILFVEGGSSSLDLPFYSALFPRLSVVPKGNCIDVERAVIGLREPSCDLHHVKAFGLIDRDDRPEEKIRKLADKGVFALGVCSVESLYYCSDAIAAVAHRQAESLGYKADKMIELAKKNALDALKQNGLAERMAARRCERTVRSSMLSQLPHWNELMDTDASSKISVCVKNPCHDELERFRKLAADGKLDDLVARYPLVDTSVFDAIAKALTCPKRKDYEQMVVTLIRKDDDLAQKLKQRIGDLSSKLEAHGRISHAKPIPL